jgi:hypothetical protein
MQTRLGDYSHPSPPAFLPFSLLRTAEAADRLRERQARIGGESERDRSRCAPPPRLERHKGGHSRCTRVLLQARKGERESRPPLWETRQPVDRHLDDAALVDTVYTTDLPLGLNHRHGLVSRIPNINGRVQQKNSGCSHPPVSVVEELDASGETGDPSVSREEQWTQPDDLTRRKWWRVLHRGTRPTKDNTS